MHRHPELEPFEERILLLAPFGQDAPIAEDILKRSGIASLICSDVTCLCSEISTAAGALVIAYEALTETTIDEFATVLEQQPAWSDIPILVFMPASSSHTAKAKQLTFDRLGNVTLMERPIRIPTFISSVQAALRARRRQYQVRTLMEELRRSNQTKDAFLAAVSHELRTPLNAILGWTTLARQANEPARSSAALDVVERNGRVLSQLVEDLLDLGRVAHGQFRLEPSTLNLADVVRAAADSVRPAAETKRIHVELEYGSNVPLIVGDAIRLQQVVWNLLWNAVKFTPERGRVSVRMRADGRLSSDRRAKESTVELEVTDSGRGISPELLPHIFDPFRQGDHDRSRRNGGLGLGLAIVKHLVELHGGSVSAHSAGLECGATFRVLLPCAEDRLTPGSASADDEAVVGL